MVLFEGTSLAVTAAWFIKEVNGINCVAHDNSVCGRALLSLYFLMNLASVQHKIVPPHPDLFPEIS